MVSKNFLGGLAGVPPHAHQAKILRHPHNENFTFSQLFMRIRLIFSILGKNQFLKLMAMGYRQHFGKKPR